MSTQRRVTFPHMGEYWIGFETLADLIGCEVVVPPRITRHTIELGARHSPEFACVPFKYTLGTFVEALEAGANVLCQMGGGCRFDYYGEVQQTILRDMGHEFEFVHFDGGANILTLLREFKSKTKAKASYAKIAYGFRLAHQQAAAIDDVQDAIRKNLGFERTAGDFDAAETRFLAELRRSRSLRLTARLRERTLSELAAIPVDKPADAPKVAVVGELYVLMEPASNYHVERELATHGVEVHRWLNMTTLISHGTSWRTYLRDMKAASAPYLTYHVGADGTESVARTLMSMKDGFDGVVHVKPFGCMPEVNAMAALQRISREHTFPILFLSCDSQNAETGLKTRVEAFCDMLKTRKQRGFDA